MLKTFINFQEQEFDPQDGECKEFTLPESCGLYEGYAIPAKEGDVFKWIQDVGNLLDLYGVDDLKVGLSRCGQIEVEDIGSIVLYNEQLFVTANIPSGLDLDCYEFIIYVDYQFDLDCTQFECSTLQDLIDSDLILGDVLNCVPIEQWGCNTSIFVQDESYVFGVDFLLTGFISGQIVYINDIECEVSTNISEILTFTGTPLTDYVGQQLEMIY